MGCPCASAAQHRWVASRLSCDDEGHIPEVWGRTDRGSGTSIAGKHRSLALSWTIPCGGIQDIRMGYPPLFQKRSTCLSRALFGCTIRWRRWKGWCASWMRLASPWRTSPSSPKPCREGSGWRHHCRGHSPKKPHHWHLGWWAAGLAHGSGVPVDSRVRPADGGWTISVIALGGLEWHGGGP
jgi:hypothetical protein